MQEDNPAQAGGTEGDPPSSEAGKASSRTETHAPTWSLKYLDEHGEKPSVPWDGAEGAHRYILRTCLNVGGCGEIWEALQVSLNRLVAVKRVHPDITNPDSPTRERELEWLRWQFRQEALITARLDHPNILPVYDLGVDPSGAPVLAMKLVRGTPWTTLIRRDREHLPREEFLERHINILIEVCKAVSFAHSRQIVHRDLKPNQVMVGEFGEVLLMDWGLAVYLGKEIEGDPTTTTLDVDLPTPLTAISPAGTPNMMAPEQTEQTADHITPATDIYLLGGTLYYLLTGTYPHEGETSDATMEAARLGLIEPLAQRAPGVDIPDDLAALALQALSRLPSGRPPSAEKFKLGLREYQRTALHRRDSHRLVDQATHLIDDLVEDDKADSAHQVSRLREEATEHSMPEAYERLNNALALLDQARGSWLGNPRIPPAEIRVITAYADAAIHEKDYTLARMMSGRLNDPYVAGELRRRIDAAQDRDLRVNRQRRRTVIAALVTTGILGVITLLYAIQTDHLNRALADERDLATSRLAEVQMAETRTQEQRALSEATRIEAERQRQIARQQQYYSAIGFASIALQQQRLELARHILTEGLPTEFRGWEWGHLMARIHPEVAMLANPEQMFHAEFSPDGHFIATGDMGHVALYETRTARMLWRVKTNDSVVWSLQFSPDGTRIAASSYDRTVALLDARTGEVQLRLEGHRYLVRDAAFSPDGQIVATGSADRALRLFDARDGRLLHEHLDHERDIYTVRYSPDGSHLLTASLDRTAILRDPRTGEPRTTLGPFEGTMLSATFSPDSRRVLLSNTFGLLRLFDAASGEPLLEITSPEQFLHDAAFTPDGGHLLSAADNGMVRAWDATTGAAAGSVLVDDPTWKVRTSPDGQWLLTTSRRSVRLIPLAGILHPALGMEDNIPDPLAQARDPLRLRIYGTTEMRQRNWLERDRLWDGQDGLHLRRTPFGDVLLESRFATYSPDFRLRAIMDRGDLSSRIIDLESGDTVYAPPMAPAVLNYIFDPNHPRVALMEPNRFVHLVHTETWETLRTIDLEEVLGPSTEHSYPLNEVAFSPDSRRVAIAGIFHGAVVLDLESGQRLHHFETLPGLGSSLAFSPDGHLLALGGTNDEGAIYSLETGEHLVTLRGHRRTLHRMVFNPDGRRLLTMAGDGAVKLWDVGTGHELVTVFERIALLRHPLGIGFSRDGRVVHVATAEGEIHSFEAIPWNPAIYSALPLESFDQQFELWNRRNRFYSEASADDLAPRGVGISVPESLTTTEPR